MFFENTDFTVKIIDVLEFKQEKKISCENSARPFYALSFRKKARTVLSHNGRTFETCDLSIALVPAGIKYTRIAEHEEMTVIHFELFTDKIDEIKVFYPENPQSYENYFCEILRIWQNKESGCRLKCSEYLMHLIYMIYREECKNSALTLSEKAAQIIGKECSSRDFSIDCLAPRLKVSGTYLRKEFKKKYSMPPKEYLTSKRMELAASLLETNYFSVKETAMRCGFENEKYFSTVFKKYFHLSPSCFKKS